MTFLDGTIYILVAVVVYCLYVVYRGVFKTPKTNQKPTAVKTHPNAWDDNNSRRR